MGTILSHCISDEMLMTLAKEFLPPKLEAYKASRRQESNSGSDNEGQDGYFADPDIEASLKEPPINKWGRDTGKRVSQVPEAVADILEAMTDFDIKEGVNVRGSALNSQKASTSKGLVNFKPIKNATPKVTPLPVHANKIIGAKPAFGTSTPIASNVSSKESKDLPPVKIVTKSKSKLKAKSSREILKETLGENGIVDNIHPIEIKATFELEPGCKASFHYSCNPSLNEELFKTDCCRDKLIKLDISLDKNGNPNVGQFIKSLLKLYTKYEGTINLNGYEIKTDKNPSRRLKINTLDIHSNPMILEMSAKGLQGVSAIKSGTKLEVRGETEFGGDTNKWIRFDGQSANEINLVAPEGKGKLFICIPAASSGGQSSSMTSTSCIASGDPQSANACTA